MKIKSLIAIAFVLCLSACNQNSKSMELKQLEGYFLRNDVTIDKTPKSLQIRDRETFEKYFGIGKTMTNTITELDFDKYFYAAEIVEVNGALKEIEVISATATETSCMIIYTVNERPGSTFKTNTFVIFEVPKSVTQVTVIKQ